MDAREQPNLTEGALLVIFITSLQPESKLYAVNDTVQLGTSMWTVTFFYNFASVQDYN